MVSQSITRPPRCNCVGRDMAVQKADRALRHRPRCRPRASPSRRSARDSSLSAGQQVHDLVAAGGVEIAGRLVGDEQRRLASRWRARSQRAAAGRPRAPPACASRGPTGPTWSSAFIASLRRSLRRHAAIDQRQLDILRRRGARQQVVALEDEADMEVAQRGAAAAVEPAGIDAEEAVAAGGRRIEAADDVHRRRLARTRKVP